jgi:hypothetical protein
MFGGIVLVAVYYAFWALSMDQSPGTKMAYGACYAIIAGSMLWFLAWTAFHTWQARATIDVFRTEVGVIALFAAFWIVQTTDLWDDENKYRSAAKRGAE